MQTERNPQTDMHGVPQPWSVGEALHVAWGAVRKGWTLAVLLVVLSAVVWLIPFVPWFLTPVPWLLIEDPGTLVSVLRPPVPGGFVELADSTAVLRKQMHIALAWHLVLLVTLSSILQPVIVLSRLRLARGQEVRSGDLLRATLRAPALLVVTIWTRLVFLGTLIPLLGVPASGFFLAPQLVVGSKMGPIQALRTSYRLSSGHKGFVWLYQRLGAILQVVALPVPFVGGLLAAHVFRVGEIHVGDRIAGTSSRDFVDVAVASRALRRLLHLTLLVLGACFGASLLIVHNLPKLRGSAFSWQDAGVRALAILLGVGVSVSLLASLLPWVLDRLEMRGFSSFVAARHVRSKKSGFLTVISVLSILGVSISSCSLSTVVSVMGGFSQDLKRKILGNNAQIVVDTTSQTYWSDYGDVLTRIAGLKGVVAATPVVHGEAMLASNASIAGVIVRGIEPSSFWNVIELGRDSDGNLDVGKVEYLSQPERLERLPPDEVIGVGPRGEVYVKGPELSNYYGPDPRGSQPPSPGIIVGRELAKTLHVYVGDEVTLVSPLGDLGPMGLLPKTKKFRIAGIFYSGMYEYDSSHVYAVLDVAQTYFSSKDRISAIYVRASDSAGLDGVTASVRTAAGQRGLRVRDWREINANLFSALKLERFATFIILSIAIMVASFCIVSTLLLMVTEKSKEIAILKAVGASDRAIRFTFMTEGLLIGGIGTVFGLATALALCKGLAWFGLRLDPEVYYIDRLPIAVNFWDFVAVSFAALTICTLATIFPAAAAARIRPVDGLRFD